jgi:hypothetical protein
VALEKAEPGTRITQPTPDVIQVVEGGRASRVVGVVVGAGGVLLLSSVDFGLSDLTGLFGLVLALFGAAVATQRFVMTLDRQRGTWTCGGDVFYLIRLRSRGLLSAVGPVRISRRIVEPSSEHGRRRVVTTFPVTVEAPKEDGDTIELRFGRLWSSVEEAHEVARPLARFLGREVRDDTAGSSG